MVSVDYGKLLEKDQSFLRLCRDVDRGHVLHAILLSGTDKAYLKSFAKAFVEKILKHHGHEQLAEKVERGSFLDLVVLDDEKSLKVGDITQIVQKSQEHGIECDQKFYIIASAEKLTEEAQNKLLKTLEEPNGDAYFILCTPSRFLLLPTIVSRCNVIELAPIEKHTIANFVAEKTGKSIEACLSAVELSLGDASCAIEQIDKTSESFELALACLQKINSSADCLRFATKLQKSNFQQILNFFEYLLVDALKMRSGVKDIWFSTKAKEMEPLKAIKEKALLFIYDAVQQIKKLREVNVSQTFLADKLVLAIAEGKHL